MSQRQSHGASAATYARGSEQESSRDEEPEPEAGADQELPWRENGHGMGHRHVSVEERNTFRSATETVTEESGKIREVLKAIFSTTAMASSGTVAQRNGARRAQAETSSIQP